jgi:hypothetical protein
MAQTQETILLQVDVVANTVRLTELRKELLSNQESLAAYNKAAKDGRISLDELAVAEQRLKADSANLNQEIKVLTKANEAQQKASQAAAGSVDELKAKSALLTAQYNAMGEAQQKTAAGQALAKELGNVNAALTEAGVKVNDFRRQVGNYAGAIEPLIAQLVKLQEQQKLAAPNSEEYARATPVIKGFQQQIAAEGAKMGLTADQTNAKLAKTAEAIRPATVELVKLEQEQAKVEKGSAAYDTIGFKIGKAAKEIEKIPTELKQVEQASDGVKSGLQSAIDKGLTPFKNELDRGTGLLGKFKSGSDLVKEGLGLLKGAGETGSLGFKAIAGGIALTGIGLFVIAISAVVAYFTQTAEGGKQLAVVLGYLGGVLQVATDLVTGLGKNLVYAFTHPLESIETFAKTVAEAIEHPIEFAHRLANGFVAIAKRANEAGKAGSEFASRTKELVIARRELDKQDAIEESRVNVLLRLSKERGKTATEQLGALEQAGKIERKITEDNIALKNKELQLIDDKIKAAGAGKTAELKADKAAKELEIIQATTAQDEVNAKIQVRESVFREKLRADRLAAAQKAREDAVRAKITLAEELLLRTDKDTAAEVGVRQTLVQLGADLEIATAKKTAEEKKLIQAKANLEIQKLADDFNAKEVERAKKQTDAVNKEREREYAEAKTNLEDYLGTKRAEIEQQQADGVLSENQAQKQLNALEKAGFAAELVNAKDYAQKTGAIEKKQADNEIKEARRVTAEKKRTKEIEQTIYEAARDAAIVGSDAVIEAFSAESEAGRAALVVKKTLALADIGIGLQKQLQSSATTGQKIQEEFPPLSVPLGIAYTIATDALAIASSGAAAAKILGFNTGGIVPGQGSTDTVPAMLTPGEVVMNQAASRQFAPVLSYLNSMTGGADFSPGFTPKPAGQIDGGLTARNVGAAPGIDYQQLAAAMSEVNLEVGVRSFIAAQKQYSKPRARTSSGG